SNEVGDIVADWALPAKTERSKPMRLQVPPQQRFSTSHHPPQLLGAKALKLANLVVWHTPLPGPPPQGRRETHSILYSVRIILRRQSQRVPRCSDHIIKALVEPGVAAAAAGDDLLGPRNVVGEFFALLAARMWKDASADIAELVGDLDQLRAERFFARVL